MPSTVHVDTFIHGVVEIEYDDATITGSIGDTDPHHVVVERIGERTHPKTPIGTRDPGRVRATIDDRALGIVPGRARLLKRSYRVGIEFGGRTMTLSAKNLEDSIFLDGDSDRGDNAFGELTRRADGTVEVMWSVPFRLGKKRVEPPVPTFEEALVGIVVAAAFGTGGLSATGLIMGAVDALLP